jgi:hypothetical protein
LSTAIRFPPGLVDISAANDGCVADFCRCIAAERSVHTMSVVIVPIFFPLSLQVAGVPEERMVKIFTANGSDMSLNEGVRYRRIRNGLDLIYIKNSQVRLPLVIQE